MSPVPHLRRDGDEALARRVARGDQAACSTLFHRYHPRLELYCRSITRNDADAQDAAQSALAKAFAALEARAPETALRPWLFRIAHNEAISLLRRRRPEGEIAPELAHHGHGPGETVELREELRDVLAALSELPPRAQHALLLRELADLDYAAVGGVLGISPGGARQAVFEARLALQADRAGREAPCEGIRQELSDRDARRRPTRRARGHLRGCSACRSWRQAQAQRRRALALAPGLPLAGGAWAWLAALASGGAAATTTSGAGTKVAVGLAALAAGGAPVAAVERELHDGAPPQARADRAAPRAATAGTRRAAGGGSAASSTIRTAVLAAAEEGSTAATTRIATRPVQDEPSSGNDTAPANHRPQHDGGTARTRLRLSAAEDPARAATGGRRRSSAGTDGAAADARGADVAGRATARQHAHALEDPQPTTADEVRGNRTSDGAPAAQGGDSPATLEAPLAASEQAAPPPLPRRGGDERTSSGSS